MNIILFEPDFFNGTTALLPYDDERGDHIRRILKLPQGASAKAGLIDGPAGEVRVIGYEGAGVRLSWSPTGPPVRPLPLTLVVGYTRPISAKRILREAASLGAERIVFTGTRNGEKSYREASLWKEGRWRRFLTDGLQQAGATVMPEVLHCRHVREAVEIVETSPACRAAEGGSGDSGGGSESPKTAQSARLLLDPEIAEVSLGAVDLSAAGDSRGGACIVVAVGSERGWTADERRVFLEAGYRPVGLGKRILRTETACTAAIAVALTRMGDL